MLPISTLHALLPLKGRQSIKCTICYFKTMLCKLFLLKFRLGQEDIRGGLLANPPTSTGP